MNIVDKNGLSALHWACDRGHAGLCEMLLAEGGDVNLQDNDGTTPLNYAVSSDHEDLAVLLVYF